MDRTSRSAERQHVLRSDILFDLVYWRECVVAVPDDPGADSAQPLRWPGRSVVLEIVTSQEEAGARRARLDRQSLEAHVQSAIPVYYVFETADWEEIDVGLFGFGPHLGEVTGVCAAPDVMSRVRPTGGGSVDIALADLPLLSWYEFVNALAFDVPMKRVPARVGSCVPLDAAVFEDPAVARETVKKQVNPGVRSQTPRHTYELVLPHAQDLTSTPPAQLFDYVPESDGMQLWDSGKLHETLRGHVAAVEARRTDGYEGVIVLTLPWHRQVPGTMSKREMMIAAFRSGMPASPARAIDPGSYGTLGRH